jgi:hypothetical protein
MARSPVQVSLSSCRRCVNPRSRCPDPERCALLAKLIIVYLHHPLFFHSFCSILYLRNAAKAARKRETFVQFTRPAINGHLWTNENLHLNERPSSAEQPRIEFDLNDGR